MDMLIKLYALPSGQKFAEKLGRRGIHIRRAMAYERGPVARWVESAFNSLWSDECSVAFSRQPIGCYIAVNADTLLGFCCLNVTYRNFIGPIGVSPKHRNQGVGKGLLISVANELYRSGYAYAVVGDVGAPGFFAKAAGAFEIPDSTPGAYPPRDMNYVV